MIFFFIIFPIFQNANENPSNNDFSDVWFIQDDKKKIICDISLSPVSISSKTIFCNNTNTMIENFNGKLGNQYELKIKGTSFSNGISVNNTIVNIILNDAKISSPSSFIVDSSTVYLFILGETNLITSSNDAGIQCSDSFIQIMNATSQEKIKNSLTVSSDKYAGIGGGASNQNCKGIFIYGGRIIANGGEFGAGIGGGEGSDKSNSAGVHKIEIVNGDITSTGGKQGAGIGGGAGKSEFSSKVDSITIFGGKVHAIGGEYSAGIGGGYGFSKSSSIVNSIEITGGEVSAKGGIFGSGIGNGYSNNREASTVNTIILDTSRTIEHSMDKNLICTTIDSTKGEKAKKAIGHGFLDDVRTPNIIERGATVSCQSDGSICSFSLSDKKCIKPWKCSPADTENCPRCILENCEHSSVYCACELCREGYTLINETCFLSNTTTSSECASKIENCIEFLNGNCRICDKCSPGFLPSQDRSACVRCTDDFRCVKFKEQCRCESCIPGYSPDPNDGFKCRACSTANCAVCGGNGGDFTACQVCSSGYFMAADKQCQKCTFTAPGSEFSCARFAPGTCTCEKCQLGYALESGQCARCAIEHCHDCSASKDRCTSCAAGYRAAPINSSAGTSEKDAGGRCEACNLPNCLAYSTGCLCSACTSGYTAQSGICASSPGPPQPIPQPPSQQPDAGDARKALAVFYCTSDSDSYACADIQSNWDAQHRQKLSEFATVKMSSYQTRVSEKFAYKKMLAAIGTITTTRSAGPSSIGMVLATVKEPRDVVVFQFGTMDQGQLYDFSVLTVDHVSIQIFPISGYFTSPSASPEIPKISIHGGKLRKVDSISCFLGSLHFDSLLELNQLSLAAVSIGDDEVISLHSNFLLIDSHNLAISNKMKIETKSFGVILPESPLSTTAASVTLSDNSLIVKTLAVYENSITVSSLIGKEQTMILTSLKKVDVRIDPSLKSKTIKKLSNISFKIDDVNSYDNSVTVSFDPQSNFEKINFKKGMVFEIQLPGRISIQNQPKNLKVVINQRDKDGQIINSNSNDNIANNDNKRPKVSGLPDHVINAIILSFILASSLLILSAYIFFKQKPKPKPKKKRTTKDSSTPLLDQVFNDGF